MAFTRKQYDDLCEAIATGAKFIKYSDKELHFNSPAQMNQLKAQMEAELGIGTARRARRRVGVYDKGLTDVRTPMAGTYVPSAGVVSQERGMAFTISIKTTPGSDTVELRNGIVIAKEYATGSEVVIPYLKSGGVYVLLPLYVNNEVRQDIDYVQGSGRLVKPGGTWDDGDYITIQLAYNA